MTNKPTEQLNEIKALMEKSTRFLSLSGLSGISAGIIAIFGAAFAFFTLNYDLRYFSPENFFSKEMYHRNWDQTLILLLADALITLVLATLCASYFTSRKARRQNLKVWNSASKRLFISLSIPLVTGGLFCLLLTWYGLIFLVAPATLIFYGLALLNGSKYTLNEIHSLGISQIILGLAATAIPGYGLIFWAMGFGVFHILYGFIMYFRHERD